MTIDLLTELGADDDRADLAVLQDVSSVAIACGLHAGTPSGMRCACQAAVSAGVAIGAHVGFNDPVGRGGRVVESHPEELMADIIYQIGALDGIALSCGGRVTFVRCAGALADVVRTSMEEADVIAAALAAYDDTLTLLVPTGSALQRAAAARGIVTVNEFIADRLPGRRGRSVDVTVCTTDQDVVSNRVQEALNDDRPPRSIGVHPTQPGDTGPLVRTVRQTIDKQGFHISAFSR